MNRNVDLAFLRVLEEFTKFLDSLPPGWCTEKSQPACDRLGDAHDKLCTALHNADIDDLVHLKDTVNRVRRDRQAARVFDDLLLKVFHAHVTENRADMHTHWRTFKRVVEESNAPLPTTEELRAEVERQFAADTVVS